MTETVSQSPSPIVRVTCRIVARFIQIFGIYVIFHGHYSPGGGFQGGGLLAAAVILLRLGEGAGGEHRELPPSLTLPLGAVGVLIYAAVGVVNLFYGGNFLQYDAAPALGVTSAQLHYWTILLVEIGVGLAVMCVLVAIFDRLMEGVADD